jgi:transposase
MEIKYSSIDDELSRDHLARALNSIVGSLDLGPFVTRARSVVGSTGRPVLSPQMLLTLWLYAIIDGVGSAREIERLTKEHAAYRWIVGNLSVAHETLSQFRAHQGEAFSKALNEILARLLEAGLIDVDVVAQDGTRIRASAGAPSFRSALALAECREHAALHLKAVLAQGDAPEVSKTAHATRVAKALDYQQRVAQAKAALLTLPLSTSTPRASTTDPDARVMKMGDGGFRPAYNAQFVVAGSEEGGPRAIVGVRVANIGSDMGSLEPLVNDVEARTGKLPKKVLADSNHFKHSDIAAVVARGVEAVVPPPRPRGETDKISVEEWRNAKMSPENRQAFRRRASLAEHANAVLKGSYRLDRLLVRGLPRVTSTITLYCLCFTLHQNIKRLIDL